VDITVRALREDEQRAAGRATADAYRELAPDGHQAWAEYLDRVADVGTRARHAAVLVAEEDGEVLGTVTLELDGRIPGGHERPALRPGEAHVRMLGVRPDARRRGVATALMDAAIAEARRSGKTFLTLDTTQSMTAAQRLYEAMRFRRAGERVFDDGFRLLSYELPLA
jgi:ribosomal protein S18 acetylase RimI-like enzyme